MLIDYPFERQGFISLITGPMKSGKTDIILHLDRLLPLKRRLDGEQIVHGIYKPTTDDKGGLDSVITRSGNTASCVALAAPEEIFRYAGNQNFVIFDEAQFFDRSIVGVARELAENLGYHVMVLGLDLDFKGEPFGSLHKLFPYANLTKKLRSVCDEKDCGQEATRTQRLISGEPAPYDSPLVAIDTSVGTVEQRTLATDVTYEARCLEHHAVPGRPADYL